MSNKNLTLIDRADDLVFEFFKETDNSFLKEKPEYRFLLLSPLFSRLCEFNLSDNQKSIAKLNQNLKVKESTIEKAEKICNIIKELIGDPTYFAASYWSPVDRRRHTISHSIYINEEERFHFCRCNALLFYILSLKAPPKFHSAINYISTKTPRKDGLHSTYEEKESFSYNESLNLYQNWFHIPNSIHQEMLNASGFNKAILKLVNLDEGQIKRSLTIIMENVDQELVTAEILKYQNIIEDVLIEFEQFEIPKDLEKIAVYFRNYLNNFFYPFDINKDLRNELTIQQAFYMACTHVLYNNACPTKMFYAFPVRVDETCCFFTLGVNQEIELDVMLAVSHIVKSVYHHCLDRDYQALNALERNRIAHGAVHKIRGPLNILIDIPYDIIDTLKESLTQEEYVKIDNYLVIFRERLTSAIENILIGVKSLEKFIDIEEPSKYCLLKIIKYSIETYKKLNIAILKDICLKGNIEEPIYVFGIPSHVQFIFEELISNSIRAFKHYNIEKTNKLEITINVVNSLNEVTINYLDNGIGIEESKKQRIFSSGFRGKDSGGSGKGLFLAKLFLNKYDNDIMECGEFGKGVNFQISFVKPKVL